MRARSDMALLRRLALAALVAIACLPAASGPTRPCPRAGRPATAPPGSPPCASTTTPAATAATWRPSTTPPAASSTASSPAARRPFAGRRSSSTSTRRRCRTGRRSRPATSAPSPSIRRSPRGPIRRSPPRSRCTATHAGAVSRVLRHRPRPEAPCVHGTQPPRRRLRPRLVGRALPSAQRRHHAVQARRARRIERRGYTILANVGDQRSDLAGGHARRAFKLPNPFYFIAGH